MIFKQYLDVIHLEDDVLDAELIHGELDRNHIVCRVHRICRKDEFQSALHSKQPDVILSDSNLPGFNAWEALTFVEKVSPSTPFFFVSGTKSTDLKVEAVCLGATDFICKHDLKPLVRHFRRIWKSAIKHPRTGEPVVLQCKGFQCLGYLDASGVWRNYETSEELHDIMSWQEI